jgi:lysophospholipase L1-like esterase
LYSHRIAAKQAGFMAGTSDSPLLTEAPRRLSLRRKVFFSLVCCVLVFAGVEALGRTIVGWRWTWLDCHRDHPVLGWCLREGWNGRWEWTAGASQVNPQGLRDERPIGPKQPGERRLLVLGDSITFGARVRTEETYCRRLEDALAAAGQPWHVLNAGVTGYDAGQEADWLELFGLRLQPDAIAIGFCINDLLPTDRSEWRRHYAANRVVQWLNEHSITFYSLQRTLYRLAVRVPRYLSKRKPEPSIDEVTDQGWPEVENAYRRIAARARERNLPVFLIIFPNRVDAEKEVSHNLRRRLKDFAAEHGWAVIDLLDVFAVDPTAMFLPKDLLHPSALGHQRSGEAIARQFLRTTSRDKEE